MEDKICTFLLCKLPEERDGFCFHHAKHFAGPKPPKEKKQIPKKSAKRVREEREYLKIVDEVLKVTPMCAVREEGCTGKATGLHHKKKRSPKTYLDKDNLIPCCDSCNLWIELHPLEAIQKGYSISKHIKTA